MIQVDEHIFQMGWFNHQVVIIFLVGDPYIINFSFAIVSGRGSIRYHPEQKLKTASVMWFMFHSCLEEGIPTSGNSASTWKRDI